MEILIFPNYFFRIQNKNNKIYVFCIIRKKFYLLTAEEWIRQNVILFLIHIKHYDPISIVLEVPVCLNGLKKRVDIVVYKKNHPHIIVECKRFQKKLTQEVFDQIFRYNIAIYSSYLMITNGILCFFFHLDKKNNHFIFLKDLPSNII